MNNLFPTSSGDNRATAVTVKTASEYVPAGLRQKLPSRKFLLRLVIGLLVLSAVSGIIAVVTGDLWGIGWQVLGTMGEIDFATLLYLCYAGKTASRLHAYIQLLGCLAAAVATVLGIFSTWESNLDADWLFKVSGVASILAISSAQACLLLPVTNHNVRLRKLGLATLAAMAVAAGLAINAIVWPNFSPSDTYWKAGGVSLIVDVLGTILILILRPFGMPAEPARS